MQLSNQHPCFCASSWQHSFPCRLASNYPRPSSCLFNSSLQKSAHVRLRFSIMSKTGTACSDFCGHKQRDSMSKHESMLYQSCSCAASYILDEECLLHHDVMQYTASCSCCSKHGDEQDVVAVPRDCVVDLAGPSRSCESKQQMALQEEQ